MMRPNAPMQPHLHHAPGGLSGIENRAALLHRVRGGFLQEHMCALRQRLDCRQRVPMIGRGNDHDLRFLPGEHLAIIIVLARLIPVEVGNLLRAHLARLLVHIANTRHLAAPVRNRLSQNIHAPPARANQGSAIFPAGRRQNRHGIERCNSSRGLQKMATGSLHLGNGVDYGVTRRSRQTKSPLELRQ